MLMVDCLNDSYLKLCVILCSLDIRLLLNNHLFGSHFSLNLIKLISVLCGVAFGSLLCACSLIDVSSIL